MSNKIYPIGIQNFEKLRTGGYFYIDKTELIYRIIKTGSYYFLSPAASGKACSYPRSKPISKARKNCSKGLPWKNWKKTGSSIRSCTWT